MSPFSRRRDPLAPRCPRRWRRRPAIHVDWDGVAARTELLRGVTPAGVAVIDQTTSAVRDLLAGFGVRMEDARELWAVAVGICVLDTGVGMSDIDDEAKEEVALFAAACMQSLVPFIGKK